MEGEGASLSQPILETALKAVVTQASREKLLPKIMWRADK